MPIESQVGKTIVKLIHLLIPFVLLLAGDVGAAEYYNPKVGEPHADFVLPRIDGRVPLKLASLRGKKVLLIQFASW